MIIVTRHSHIHHHFLQHWVGCCPPWKRQESTQTAMKRILASWQTCSSHGSSRPLLMYIIRYCSSIVYLFIPVYIPGNSFKIVTWKISVPVPFHTTHPLTRTSLLIPGNSFMDLSKKSFCLLLSICLIHAYSHHPTFLISQHTLIYSCSVIVYLVTYFCYCIVIVWDSSHDSVIYWHVNIHSLMTTLCFHLCVLHYTALTQWVLFQS